MNSNIHKAIAKASAAAMLLSSFAMVLPASAAGVPTVNKDTMSREKVSVAAVTHVVTMTMPSAQTGTLTLSYGSDFSTFAYVSSTCTTGTAVDNATGTNIAALTLTACTGTLTFTFTGTNASVAGSYPVALGGTSLDAGTYYAVPITAEDQISVTASVNPYITFDLEASATVCDHGTSASPTDHTPNANVYLVAFGTLSPLAASSSGTGGTGIQHVCTTVSTNASAGYALSVLSLNGGLFNGTQYINNNATETAEATNGADTTAAGSEHYVMCLATGEGNTVDTTTPAGSTVTGDSPFNPGSCTSASNDGGALTTNTQTIGHSTTPFVAQEGTAEWLLKTSIASTTAAGSYADTLTFIATGTF